MRVTRATDAAHPVGSLPLAQIRARGGFYRDLGVGRGRCAGSGWVRHGGAAPGCRGAAGRSGQRSREQREEEGEGADGRARSVSGDVERRAGELGLGHRWAEREVEEEVGCGHVREKKRVCGPAERWRDRGGLSEGDRAAGKGGRVSGRRKREGGNGPVWGKDRPKGREEAGWAAWAELPSPILFEFK
jgi:hypothetical protein